MSSRDHLAAVADGAGGSVKARPAGLPEKLMVAIQPEFRADVLVLDPRDPVFGGPPVCGVRVRPPSAQPADVLESPATLVRRGQTGPDGVCRDD